MDPYAGRQGSVRLLTNSTGLYVSWVAFRVQDVRQSRQIAKSLLATPLPRRWAHTQGVAVAARHLVRILGADAGLIEAAGVAPRHRLRTRRRAHRFSPARRRPISARPNERGRAAVRPGRLSYRCDPRGAGTGPAHRVDQRVHPGTTTSRRRAHLLRYDDQSRRRARGRRRADRRNSEPLRAGASG